MKIAASFLLISFLFIGCNRETDNDLVRQQVFQTEKSFERMAAEKGIAEAFYFFADDSAVIKRQNDTLITGKENIRKFYSRDAVKNASVKWSPDFIDVSESGDLAYTYGKYIWYAWNKDGDTTEFRGVFHTVWKRQSDGSWKYVWD